MEKEGRRGSWKLDSPDSQQHRGVKDQEKNFPQDGNFHTNFRIDRNTLFE